MKTEKKKKNKDKSYKKRLEEIQEGIDQEEMENIGESTKDVDLLNDEKVTVSRSAFQASQ